MGAGAQLGDPRMWIRRRFITAITWTSKIIQKVLQELVMTCLALAFCPFDWL
jgi:hypothetical protein